MSETMGVDKSQPMKARCFRRADGQTIEGCDRVRFRSHGTCEMVYQDDTFEVLPMSLAEAERAVSRGIWVEVNDSRAQAHPSPAAMATVPKALADWIESVEQHLNSMRGWVAQFNAGSPAAKALIENGLRDDCMRADIKTACQLADILARLRATGVVP